MRRIAGLLVLVALLGPVASAGADGVTGAGLHALAIRAQHDPAARARLARVDHVDGRPVDLARALHGATGAVLQARLRTLAAGTTPAANASSVRAEARAVLAERRFHEQTLPRPLHGPLAWLGRRLRPLGRPFEWLARELGGTNLALTLLGIVVALAATVLAFYAGRRRAAAELLYFPELAEGAGSVSPAELERLAAQRERDGDFEGAVRLRFRAGLLRLDRARAIRYRPSLTSAELSRSLRSDDFDGVAHDFDEIVYGGRPAAEQDARAASEGWQRVLARVRGKGSR